MLGEARGPALEATEGMCAAGGTRSNDVAMLDVSETSIHLPLANKMRRR